MRTLAFYLPQFHAIPENDRWWGEGFTEWVNVGRAKPSFDGHTHPRVPTTLGRYDLTDPAIHHRQSDLARANGVDGFCIYFYWFNGARLLEKPIDAWRADSTLLPYSLSWANESWTRRWDGKSRSVLMSQDYEQGFAEGLFADLLPHLRAPHYVRQGGSPLLLVHRAEQIPDAPAFARAMREMAVDAGLPGLHLVASETTPGLRPASVGFDAVAQFPPVGANTLATAQLAPLRGVRPGFRGRLMSYPKLARRAVRTARRATYPTYAGVAPGWDNSARRGDKATVYVGSNPALYARWLAEARKIEQERHGDDGLVFINAWNEWAEGAYLEPDAQFGEEYLRATADPARFTPGSPFPSVSRGPVWSYAQLHSMALAAAGTALAAARRVRNATSRTGRT